MTCPKCGGRWFERDDDGDPCCLFCGFTQRTLTPLPYLGGANREPRMVDTQPVCLGCGEAIKGRSNKGIKRCRPCYEAYTRDPEKRAQMALAFQAVRE